jgi:methionyl-tRNA formyltransferase
LNNKTVKIFSCTKENATPQEPAGTYITDNKSYLKFVCDNGYINTLEIQMEGKKRIKIEEFLKGFRG